MCCGPVVAYLVEAQGPSVSDDTDERPALPGL
jgi:hypothetical protein